MKTWKLGISILFFTFLWGLLMFIPNGQQSASAASYTPYMSQSTSIGVKGGRDQDTYSRTSGKLLVYDVYAGKDGKSGLKIATHDYGKGSQEYLEFTGWSALLSYHNHYKDNQDTYIYVKNAETGEKKLYRAEMLNYDASKDLEYGRTSTTGDINNPAPDSVYNALPTKYNMYYKYVGFRAHIPLKDLFPNGIDESQWKFYIVKKVEDHTVYSTLQLPFHFENTDYSNGKLSLDSGVDADEVQPQDSDIIRRTTPRGTTKTGYFSKNQIYHVVDQDEGDTVSWIGVKSPEDDNQTRWAVSPYWIFYGEQATLSFVANERTITVVHKDKITGKVLRTDKHTVLEGEKYSYSPEDKGVFTTDDDIPYVSTSKAVSGTAGTSNTTITFYYVPQNTYTIEHRDRATGEILEKKTEYVNQGDSYSYKAYEDGHFKKGSDPYVSVSKDAAVSGTAGIGNKTFVFDYAVQSTIKVNHVDKYSGKVLRTDSYTMLEGDSYSFKPEEDGVFKNGTHSYVASPSNQVLSGKALDHDQTLQFTYGLSTTITINHKDKITGKTILTETHDVLQGESFSYSPKSDGTLKKGSLPYISTPSDQQFTGKGTDQDQSYTFYYTAQATMTVKYIDKATGNTLKTETHNVLEGDSYDYKPYEDGYFKKGSLPYVLNDSNKEFTGKVSDQNQTFSFYYSLQSIITVDHIDQTSKAVLKTETHKVLEGESFNYGVATKGTFKDKDGNPYVASPLGQSVSGKGTDQNQTFTLTYRVSLKDPSHTEELDGATAGKVKGEFYWELHRNSQDSDPVINTSLVGTIIGKHFAVKDFKANLVMGNGTSLTSVSTIGKDTDTDISVQSSESVKDLQDKTISPNITYTYTNYYTAVYEPEEYQKNPDGTIDVFKWKFKDNEPLWDKAETFDLSKQFSGVNSLNTNVNSVSGKTISVDNMAALAQQKFPVGTKKDFDMNQSSNSLTSNRSYYETIKQAANESAKDVNHLQSQNWIAMAPGTLEYSISLPSGSQSKNNFLYTNSKGSFGYYYVNDIDDNLKDDYPNDTEYKQYGKYALPLQYSQVTDKGMNGESRTYDLNYVSDLFFIGKDTGYITSYPYVSALKVNGLHDPDMKTVVNQTMDMAKQTYKEKTGSDYNDSFLYVDSSDKNGVFGNKSELQRYYLPINSESIYKKGQTYENKVLLEKVGLSDANIVFNQRFDFKQYLVGSVMDDVENSEQKDTTIPDVNYTHSITLSPSEMEKIHEEDQKRTKKSLFGFRLSDATDWVESLENIIGSIN
ncbi:MucBP domain-containing protein [Heyndrickxia ginsengihumi]|uniref:MucBP domain-containing protein n=1 Tax=Heyndrickxia ginsengihumi TaxID=363870 RepID=UPI000470E50E|nr:MucBP domain-containing protein [Heyndrickxia ginsengihumi]